MKGQHPIKFRDIQFEEAHRLLSKLVRELAGKPALGYRILKGERVVAELVGLPLEPRPSKAASTGRSRRRKPAPKKKKKR